MGREIRRVAVDFDWPLNTVWEGFLLPERLRGTPCTQCYQGQTHFGWWLQNFSYVMGMLATDVREQQAGRPMHPWLTRFERAHGHFQYADDPQSELATFVIDRPGEDALEFFAALIGKPVDAVGGNGYDGNVPYAVYHALEKASAMDFTCKICDGEGSLEQYEGQKAEREAWYEEDSEAHAPPIGEGWQMWETVSEGSPVSPVFASAEELAQWLTTAEGGYASGPSHRPMSIEAARGFVSAGWAPSMFSDSAGIHDGAAYVGASQAKKETS